MFYVFLLETEKAFFFFFLKAITLRGLLLYYGASFPFR